MAIFVNDVACSSVAECSRFTPASQETGVLNQTWARISETFDNSVTVVFLFLAPVATAKALLQILA